MSVNHACKVSVIVPCFNHGEFLPEAVASVAAVRREDFELIVVDDGSTDSRTRVEMDKLAAGGVHVIRQENKGLAAARNAAISAARGEFIFPLDADDRMRSGWIERGIAILESRPEVGVVYGDAQCFGTRTWRWEGGEFELGKLLQGNHIHCSALYRRTIWEQNGGYDGTMPVQGLEDWDFWVGAAEHGWEFAYLQEIFLDYRQSNGSMLTRKAGFDRQLEEFVARKHAVLYRKALVSVRESLLSLERERQSVRQTARHLRNLLRLRLKQKMNAGRSPLKAR